MFWILLTVLFAMLCSSQATATLVGDFDDDGLVGFDDFFLFADAFGDRVESGYVHARGSQLVIGADDTPILLQGVNFSTSTTLRGKGWRQISSAPRIMIPPISSASPMSG
jgi:hypothetical protein